MIGKLIGNEGVNAAVVIALSGAVMALVAKGNGPLSLGRVVSGALSNPIPANDSARGASNVRGGASAPDHRTAA